MIVSSLPHCWGGKRGATSRLISNNNKDVVVVQQFWIKKSFATHEISLIPVLCKPFDYNFPEP